MLCSRAAKGQQQCCTSRRYESVLLWVGLPARARGQQIFGFLYFFLQSKDEMSFLAPNYERVQGRKRREELAFSISIKQIPNCKMKGNKEDASVLFSPLAYLLPAAREKHLHVPHIQLCVSS